LWITSVHSVFHSACQWSVNAAVSGYQR
jgi:hypothetical protein